MNDNKDFLSDGIIAFRDNMIKKNPNAITHNLYEFTTVDENENVIDTKYGMNTMTDIGFDVIYKNKNEPKLLALIEGTTHTLYSVSVNATRCYTGDGTGTIKSTDTDLFHDNGLGYMVDDSWTGSNSTIEYINGKMVMYSFIYKGHFDYTISGINDPVNITEVGFKNYYYYKLDYYSGTTGYLLGDLLYHAKIYDVNGNPTTLIKKPYQKTYISFYVTTAFDPSLITRLYNQGIYMLTNLSYTIKTPKQNVIPSIESSNYLSNHILITQSRKINQNAVWYISGTSGTYDYIVTYTSLLDDITKLNDDGVYKKSIPSSGVIGLIEKADRYMDVVCANIGYNHGIYHPGSYSNYGYYNDNSSFMLFRPIYQDEDEEFEISMRTIDNSILFDIGTRTSACQFTSFNISEFNVNNVKTLTEMPYPYTGTANKNYINSFAYGVRLYLKNNVIATTNFEVFVNINTSDKIKSLRLGMTNNDSYKHDISKAEKRVWYATDTYWDPSTFIEIKDVSNFTDIEGSKRYYLYSGYAEDPHVFAVRENELRPDIGNYTPVTHLGTSYFGYQHYNYTDRAYSNYGRKCNVSKKYKICSVNNYYAVLNDSLTSIRKSYSFGNEGYESGKAFQYSGEILHINDDTGKMYGIYVNGTTFKVYECDMASFQTKSLNNSSKIVLNITVQNLREVTLTLGGCYVVQKTDGFIVINTNETDSNGMLVYKTYDGLLAVASDSDETVVYRTNDSTKYELNILDIESDTVTKTFTPTFGNVDSYWAFRSWKNYVWIAIRYDGLDYMYMYDTENDTCAMSSKQLPCYSNFGADFGVARCDDCVIYYPYGPASEYDGVLYFDDNKCSLNPLKIFSNASYMFSNHLAYFKEGNILLLLTYYYVFDIGLMKRKGTDSGCWYETPYKSTNYTQTSCGCTFDNEHVFVTEKYNEYKRIHHSLFLKYIMRGTTNTITFQNYPKYLGKISMEIKMEKGSDVI